MADPGFQGALPPPYVFNLTLSGLSQFNLFDRPAYKRLLYYYLKVVLLAR
jgi:hypothetical protein